MYQQNKKNLILVKSNIESISITILVKNYKLSQNLQYCQVNYRIFFDIRIGYSYDLRKQMIFHTILP